MQALHMSHLEDETGCTGRQVSLSIDQLNRVQQLLSMLQSALSHQVRQSLCLLTAPSNAPPCTCMSSREL